MEARISCSVVCIRRGNPATPARTRRRRQRTLRVQRSATGDDRDGGGWTPFSLPEAEPSSRLRVQRMIETRRGEAYVDDPEPTSSATPSPEDGDACAHCRGTGRQVCEYCSGLGRTNYRDRAVLPKGVWPQWCSRCIRCSGETVCGYCLGSGKKREPIGFRVGS